MVMRGSRNFCQGGPGQSDKKALTTFFLSFFLVLSLFYRSQMDNFKENYHFKVPEGSKIFQGGGGGSNCLFPIETHITCDFQGVRTPCPPSGSALGGGMKTNYRNIVLIHFYVM